jgi:hypothetical protein
MKYQKSDGGRKQAFPNAEKRAGDCVIRSIAIATQQDYKKVWNDLFSIALETGNFPNTDIVCVTYLERQGWERIKFGKKLVRLNSKFIPKDKTIICHVRRHWVAMIDGTIYDTWDCRKNSWDDYNRVFSYYIKK